MCKNEKTYLVVIYIAAKTVDVLAAV